MPTAIDKDLTNRPILVGVFLANKNPQNGYHPSQFRVELLGTVNRVSNAILFFFSLDDIDYQDFKINGVCYDKIQGRWVNKIFSFPDVLYLRGKEASHRRQDFEHFQSVIRARKVSLVNNLARFNKWDVYRALCADSSLKPYLPETRLYRKQGRNNLELELMLRDYGGAYLKACRGSRGRQVMQVKRLPGGFYEYRYFAGKLISRKVNMIGSLYRIIDQFFNGQEFIIQEPVDLITVNGSKADLRAEMQRNGEGELEIVAIPVRVARDKSPITTHAYTYRFDDFFTRMMGYSETALHNLKNRLHNLLFKLYNRLEDDFGPFGEIGIDIGLDKKDQLWFIECNSQSARVSLMEAYSGDPVIRAFTNPLEYALYIAGSARRDSGVTNPKLPPVNHEASNLPN